MLILTFTKSEINNMGEDIRRRVVTSFRNAIDLEQNNSELEAYCKYLDGVALVAAALLQDCECRCKGGISTISDKERRSLVGFAQQSVDRIAFLLDKQQSDNLFRGTTSNRVIEKDSKLENTIPNAAQNAPRHCTLSTGHLGAGKPDIVVEEEESDVSPLARVKQENKLLIARYAARLQAATAKSVRHNLQLELQRHLMENTAIAQQQQQAWEQRRSKIAAWCLKVAERKFKIKEKIENGTITEADFKKQRLFASALQYEEENVRLKKLKLALLGSPQDEIFIREVIIYVLNDKLHPLGCLLIQMQQTVLNKINPLIKSRRKSIPVSNINERQGELSVDVISDGLHSLETNLAQKVNPGIENSGSCLDQEAAIAKEEEEALQRHFNNIADDVKQDIKLLETLFCSLYEPLNSELGNSMLTELLHELYFPHIKPSLIALIRLGSKALEEDLAYRMSVEQDRKNGGGKDVDIDEELVKSCCHALHRLVSISSPCQMLDSLGAILKILATSDDDQTKSLGADDLLPRLMNVVMACGMPHLVAEAIYMENFMPVSRALGEAGYCLTVLQSVMSCVQIPTG